MAHGGSSSSSSKHVAPTSPGLGAGPQAWVQGTTCSEVEPWSGAAVVAPMLISASSPSKNLATVLLEKDHGPDSWPGWSKESIL